MANIRRTYIAAPLWSPAGEEQAWAVLVHGHALADKIVHEDMRRVGIDVRDPQQPVGSCPAANVSASQSRGRFISAPRC